MEDRDDVDDDATDAPDGGGTAPAASTDLIDIDVLDGAVIAGRYEVAQIVSAGSNTVIVDALDRRAPESAAHPVTVKIVRPELIARPDFLPKFRVLADLTQALTHPNISSVLDWGELEVEVDGQRESTVFWVVDALGGGSLRDLLDRGRTLTPGQALVVGLEACRALDAAHQRGLFHTELTPSKMVFGSDRRLRIVDFGMARLLAEPTWEDASAVPTHVARYASPEQAIGLGVDAKTDVYALALVLVEAVTGAVPFAADSTVATLAGRVDRLLPVSADLGALAAILERAARPEADDRYTAAEFGRALVQAASNLPRPEPIPVLSTGMFDSTSSNLRRPADPTGAPERPVSNEQGESGDDDGAARVGVVAAGAAGAAAGLAFADDAETVAASPVAASPAGVDQAVEADATTAAGLDAATATASATASATGTASTTGPGTASATGAGPETGSDSGTDTEFASDTDTDIEAGTETGTDTETDTETDTGTYTGTDTYTGTARDTDTETDTGTETAADTALDDEVEADDDDRPVIPVAVPSGDDLHFTDEVLATASPRSTEQMPAAVVRPAPDAAPPVGGSVDEPAPVLYDEQPPRRRKGPIVLVVVLLLAGLGALGYAATLLFQPNSFEVPVLAGQPVDRALNQIAGNDWEVSYEYERSDSFPDPQQVIRTEPEPGIELEEGEPFLIVLSEGPEFRILPELAEQPFDEAAGRLAALGLNVTEAPAREFSETLEPGSVVSWQVLGNATLVAGDEILPGETVILTLSAGPEPRAVPSFAGLTLDDAVARADQLQLQVISGDGVFSDDVPEGLVVSQNPAEGSSLERGGTITVELSLGPDVVPLPDLDGLTFDEASVLLDESGFVIGRLLGTTDGVFVELTIAGEEVQPGTEFPRGTVVDVIFL